MPRLRLSVLVAAVAAFAVAGCTPQDSTDPTGQPMPGGPVAAPVPDHVAWDAHEDYDDGEYAGVCVDLASTVRVPDASCAHAPLTLGAAPAAGFGWYYLPFVTVPGVGSLVHGGGYRNPALSGVQVIRGGIPVTGARGIPTKPVPHRSTAPKPAKTSPATKAPTGKVTTAPAPARTSVPLPVSTPAVVPSPRVSTPKATAVQPRTGTVVRGGFGSAPRGGTAPKKR